MVLQRYKDMQLEGSAVSDSLLLIVNVNVLKSVVLCLNDNNVEWYRCNCRESSIESIESCPRWFAVIVLMLMF